MAAREPPASLRLLPGEGGGGGIDDEERRPREHAEAVAEGGASPMDGGSEESPAAAPHSPPPSGEKPFLLPAAWEDGSGDENTLVIHSQVEEEAHKCVVCGENFSQQLSLLRHQKQQHAGERAFVCAECGRGFSLKHNLIIHQRIHTGEKPFGCGVCGKRFSLKQNLLTHQRVHGSGGREQERPFSCPTCGKNFREQRLLLAHQNGDCGSGGKAKEAPLAQQRVHGRGRPRAAGGCSESCAQRPLQVQHQEKTHRNGAAAAAALEGRENAEGFGRRAALAGHRQAEGLLPGDDVRRHLGPHEASRSSHRRLRPGEDPFRCLMCGKSFAQKGNLAAHQRSHLGQEALS